VRLPRALGGSRLLPSVCWGALLCVRLPRALGGSRLLPSGCRARSAHFVPFRFVFIHRGTNKKSFSRGKVFLRHKDNFFSGFFCVFSWTWQI